MSRRRFLQSATVSMAATACVGVAHAQSADEKKIVVGAHPWVYAATQPGYDITPILEGIFADMKYAGMEAIELMHTALRPDDAVERIASLSEKHGLPVLGTSFGGKMFDRAEHNAILEDAERVITRLAKLGGRTLGTSVGGAGKRKTPEQFDAQADLLKRIIAVAKAHGVVLNLHNHTYEVVDDMHDLRGTLDRIPEVKLGPDLNWLVRGGVDPVEFIHRFGERIVFLHLRDQKSDGAWSEAMGEGDMDYVGIGKALRKVNFTGDAVIELAHERGFQLTRPLRESLKISRQYVRSTLGY
ncbi:MAG: sugar phosphate isomerase/epimerase [Planctomycetota bacterium]